MRTEALKRIALGILCLAAFAACGADKTVSNKEFGFEITFPEAWTVIKKVDPAAKAEALSPRAVDAKKIMKVGVRVLDIKQDSMLKEVVDGIIKQVENEQLKGYKLLTREQTRIGGQDGTKVIILFDDTSEGTWRIRSELYTIVSNNHSFTVCLFSVDDDYSKYAKDIDSILKSFKLINAFGADKIVTDKKRGYEIVFPQAWTVNEYPTGGLNATLPWLPAGERKIGVIAYVSVRELKEGTSLKQFSDDQYSRMQELTHFELVEKSELKLGDSSSVKVVHLYDQPRVTATRREIIYLLVSGKRGYEFRISTRKDDYDTYAKDIDAIVKSFKLIEAK